jgi:ubiquitin-conjugating enzyme E2 Q
MPRKEFQRDLIGAKVSGGFPHLNCVRAGDHDGSISFTFADSSTGTRIDFQAIVSGKASSGPVHDRDQLTSR